MNKLGNGNNLDEMMKEYSSDAWQIQIIASTVEAYVNERNTYLYGTEFQK